MKSQTFRRAWVASAMAVLILMGALAGCTTTQQVSVQRSGVGGFLGDMVIPQARALSTLKYLATGTYPFIGGAEAEAKMTDSQTGQLLGEWVDKRVGGGSIKTAAQWQWGDAENAMKEWATMAATKLSSWTSGAVKPS